MGALRYKKNIINKEEIGSSTEKIKMKIDGKSSERVKMCLWNF